MLGVLGSFHCGRLLNPDISGPPRGVMEVASVVGLKALWKFIGIVFHVIVLILVIVLR